MRPFRESGKAAFVFAPGTVTPTREGVPESGVPERAHGGADTAGRKAGKTKVTTENVGVRGGCAPTAREA
jgi:hypothetical protein